ncbi:MULTISPECIES: ATP-binding cassette domain-containing protein [Methylobacterium]|uniref:Glutamine transport ATP-binding protein GlnQ n=1 Tax=Methylobacterium jeotgali TaxID=381630 RepID=A0ABQ4T1C7_9HYPH|nr:MULTISPECIES: ATP-binding cassette domain-containing protein [Methylobacterium]PIU07982.1 MAG: ABC transporter [Methylobacterium sp. CG09_land_8_20_14_0_10_71_15]PIU15776.1 MAG: ABC transporter [Methylobacterium sp. CG08_land_8_20_14_0_20_71_15]GBU17907.1 phosphonates import ATP-binding protein PhnC [Methylobacterium sp.]GJE08563.1 Glutamine transport ATP-binding protein GlnQ [Methylobacterium jeotgali]
MPHTPIVLSAASASYGGRAVLSGIDLTIRPGERVALLGRSGAGKSTLLGLIYEQARRDAALVPQAAALVRPLSVFHNVYMGRLDRRSTLHNLRTLLRPARADVEAVRAVLDRVGLADTLRRRAGELSGGQQQRVSVARALYNGRPVLIGDEPVSALDRRQGAAVLGELKASHATLVVALHDIALALAEMSRIVVLDHGRIVLDAPAAGLDPARLAPYYEPER